MGGRPDSHAGCRQATDAGLDVRYVAKLAHLELTDDEVAVFGRQLGSVLAYMDKLAGLNLDGIEPTSHGVPAENSFRMDLERPGFDREAALANAPMRTLTEFKVPKIVE